MSDEMTKAGPLEALHAERRRWDALLAEVGEERMTTPILASWWSVKDIIAHVMWYEQQITEALQPDARRRPARSWLWNLTVDKRNAILYSDYPDQPLAEIRAEAQRVFAQLVARVEALSDEEIRNPHTLPNMRPAWQLWPFIARHSYEHYQQHMIDIRAWLDSLGSQTASTVGHEGAGDVLRVPTGVAAL